MFIDAQIAGKSHNVTGPTQQHYLTSCTHSADYTLRLLGNSHAQTKSVQKKTRGPGKKTEVKELCLPTVPSSAAARRDLAW